MRFRIAGQSGTLDVSRISVYSQVVIESFRDRHTEDFAAGRRVRRFFGVERAAMAKLVQLEAASSLGDLARPGNRLERLRGDREGQWSIRINERWRICFVWATGEAGPSAVEIVDYH